MAKKCKTATRTTTKPGSKPKAAPVASASKSKPLTDEDLGGVVGGAASSSKGYIAVKGVTVTGIDDPSADGNQSY